MRRFKNLAKLQVALREWLARYNERWLVERHGYRTPAQVRQDLLAVQVAA